MAAGIDRFNTGKLEVPFKASLRMREGGNESSGSSINMDRYIVPGLGFKLVKNFRDFLYWLVMAGVSRLWSSVDDQ